MNERFRRTFCLDKSGKRCVKMKSRLGVKTESGYEGRKLSKEPDLGKMP